MIANLIGDVSQIDEFEAKQSLVSGGLVKVVARQHAEVSSGQASSKPAPGGACPLVDLHFSWSSSHSMLRECFLRNNHQTQQHAEGSCKDGSGWG
jgi:hypothetical protein